MSSLIFTNDAAGTTAGLGNGTGESGIMRHQHESPFSSSANCERAGSPRLNAKSSRVLTAGCFHVHGRGEFHVSRESQSLKLALFRQIAFRLPLPPTFLLAEICSGLRHTYSTPAFRVRDMTHSRVRRRRGLVLVAYSGINFRWSHKDLLARRIASCGRTYGCGAVEDSAWEVRLPAPRLDLSSTAEHGVPE